MSRIGKNPIIIPAKVNIKIDKNHIDVDGPKGKLSLDIHPKVLIKTEADSILVSVKDPQDKEQNSLWGLSRTLINNMIIGVTEGFSKQLEINGIGFKAQISGKLLVLNVGFSHPVEYNISEDIQISVEKNVITITGIDKQKVGQIAAEIRTIKKPEPYKGKGIKYIDEVIRRKAGKVVKSAGA